MRRIEVSLALRVGNALLLALIIAFLICFLCNCATTTQQVKVPVHINTSHPNLVGCASLPMESSITDDNAAQVLFVMVDNYKVCKAQVDALIEYFEETK